MTTPPPGAPVDWTTCTPDNCPVNALVKSGEATFSRSSEEMDDTEPVISFRCWVPYPTTTTSSRDWMSSSSVTSMVLRSATCTFLVRYPMNEKLSTASPEATVIEYVPSTSVTVPLLVPISRTVTPGNGLPVASVTLPDMTTCCLESSDGKTTTS